MRFDLQGLRPTTAEELTRRNQLYRSIFIVQVIGLLLFAVLGSFEQRAIEGLLMVNAPTLLLLALMFFARGLVQRGSYLAGVSVTLTIIIIALAYFSAFYGFRSPIPFICIWPILVSSILLNPSSGFGFATLTSMILAGLLVVEFHQILPLPINEGDQAYSRDWHLSEDPAIVMSLVTNAVTTMVVFYLAAFLAWLYARSLHRAVERSESVIEKLKQTAEHNSKVASKINTASSRLGAWLREQQQGAWAQSEAVQEIAESVRELLDSSREIFSRSAVMAQSAEKSLENDDQIVERIEALSAHTERIGEILEVMKEIANKSDILALNAALEGVKAGEQGEGFVLVAARIQVMAEDVLGSLANIKTIIRDIRTASEAAISSTRLGTELTKRAAELTQQIGAITVAQKEGAELVSRAIRDIENVAQQTVVASTEVLQAMTGLVELSNEIHGFTEGSDMVTLSDARAEPAPQEDSDDI